ncbi:MAG: hypothetical protein J6S92_05410 [Oscillospiraceae bacterium]|nr:hypothetical protein [Oscillospiraceae bacterium]
MNQKILDGNVDMFLSCGYEPSSLANGCVPVDIDVSPFDNSGSHKAGVSRTYKNFDGYEGKRYASASQHDQAQTDSNHD